MLYAKQMNFFENFKNIFDTHKKLLWNTVKPFLYDKIASSRKFIPPRMVNLLKEI